MSNVLAYGADYSARELSLAELAEHNRRNPDQPISALIRYIGYPDNPKCVSHYPGALTRFREAGYLVLLFVQNGWDDYLGGYEGGKAAARRALEDARREGYPEHLPFIFACDRYLVAKNRTTIPGGTALEFLRGAAEIVGAHRTWSYGFWDLQDLVLANPGTVAGHVLCGARSTNRGSLIWQENNEQPVIGGVQTDRLEFYVSLDHFGGDDMSAQDVMGYKIEVGYDGTKEPLPFDQVTRGTNYGVWETYAIAVRLEQGQAAQIAALAAIAHDAGITKESLAEVVQDAVGAANTAHLAQVDVLLREMLGHDNEDLARAFVAELSRRMAAGSTPPSTGQ